MSNGSTTEQDLQRAGDLLRVARAADHGVDAGAGRTPGVRGLGDQAVEALVRCLEFLEVLASQF